MFCSVFSLLAILMIIIDVSVAQKTEINNIKCILSVRPGFLNELEKHLSEGATMVEMNVRLKNHPADVLETWLKGVYKPHLWTRPTGKKGRSLLRLGENYSSMSLFTLSIGVVKMDVDIEDTPTGCLKWQTPRNILSLIRSSFLTDFKRPESGEVKESLDQGKNIICNMRVVNDNSYARFRYRCCNQNDGQIFCENMIVSGWIQVLLVIILFIKIVVLLYSPLLLPEMFYRVKFKACEYIYQVPKAPLTLRVVVTQDPLQYGEENKDKRVRLSDLHHMEYFKAMVSGNRWQQDKVYELKVKECRLSVCIRRLLDRCHVPVGLTTLLYDSFIKCRIRKLASLKACCDSSILGNFYQGQDGNILITWSWCLRILARICLLLLLAIPWAVRVLFYFQYESESIEELSRIAAHRGLKIGFDGGLVSYLGPIHGLFIIIYVIILVDAVMYGIVTHAMRERLNKVMLQCLSDMRERSRISVISWLVKLLVLPFATCGVLAFLVFPFYAAVVLILTLPLMAFYLLPTLNLSVRLIIHMLLFLCPAVVKSKFDELCCHKTNFFKQRLRFQEVTANETFVERHYYSTCGVILQLLVIVMCLISFWSITLLLVETISFFAEMFVYTMVGMIVNTSVSLQVMVLLSLLCLYGKIGVARMRSVYLEYHKSIHSILTAVKKKEIDAVAIREDTIQQNTAFTVVGDMTTLRPLHPKPVLVVKNHIPQWKASGMLVFMDHLDKAYTPEKFFHKIIDLKYNGCPGPLYLSVLRATWDFVKVGVFLFILCVIILVVGDIYEISSTNQLLATVAVGLIPFFCRSRASGATANTTNIQFKTDLHRAINNYEQSWPAFDIIPVCVREAEDYPSTNDGNDGQENTTLLRPSQDGNGKLTKATNVARSSVHMNSSDEIRQAANSHDEDNKNDFNRNASQIVSDNVREVVHPALITGHEIPLLPSASSMFSIEDDLVDIDIIVDLSTSNTRSNGFMLKKKGFETGSLSMLDIYRQRPAEPEREVNSKHTEEIV